MRGALPGSLLEPGSHHSLHSVARIEEAFNLTRQGLFCCFRKRIFSGLCEPTKAHTVLVSTPSPLLRP